MRHGCMVMTLRLSSSCRSGNHQIHCGRNKRVKFAAMSSQCWSFFSTSKALSTRNSYPLVKPSRASFTVRFWSGWGRAFGTNVQASGRKTTGFSTMSTCPLTHHSLFDNSWLPNTLQWFPTPLLAWLCPLRIFPIPQDEITAERASFWHDWGDPHRNAKVYWHSHLRTSRDAWNHGKQAGIAVYMTKWATSKETVETRSYNKKLFFTVKFPEFLGSPTYWHLNYKFLYWYTWIIISCTNKPKL